MSPSSPTRRLHLARALLVLALLWSAGPGNPPAIAAVPTAQTCPTCLCCGFVPASVECVAVCTSPQETGTGHAIPPPGLFFAAPAPQLLPLEFGPAARVSPVLSAPVSGPPLYLKLGRLLN